MKQILSAMALACLAAVAHAAPVYLECDMTASTGKTSHARITLNEDAQNAIYDEDGYSKSVTVPAQFTADSVLFKWNPLAGIMNNLSLQYNISRTTLEITEVSSSTGAVTKGLCKIAQPPANRKF